MANIYVRSTDGSDADNGSTWALAKATLAGAAGIDADGDTIWLSQNHAESSASAQTIALAGTATNPVKVICGNDSAEPPTTLTTGAVVQTTGANSITINGIAYIDGVSFKAGSSTSTASINIGAAGNIQTYANCSIELSNSGASSSIVIGAPNTTAASILTFKDTNFIIGRAGGQLINVFGSIVNISGGSITNSAGSTGGTLFSVGNGASGEGSVLNIIGVDLSSLHSSINLVYASTNTTFCVADVKFVNCKLPASWSGGVINTVQTSPGQRIGMYNCDSGATNYRLWIEDFPGSIKSETTIVKTGGASDGTTALSWKMSTTDRANEYVSPLVSDNIVIWNETTGTSKTITIDIVHDSTTALTDAEIWLEIDYLGSSAAPLGTNSSDKRATVLTTAADQTTSSATWTTTGLTNPNKQKLEVTFTPQMKGFVYARVCLAKPSYTVYVDYEPTIS